MTSDDAAAAIARVTERFGGLDAIEQELATHVVDALLNGRLRDQVTWQAYVDEILQLRPGVTAGRLTAAEAHSIAIAVAVDSAL